MKKIALSFIIALLVFSVASEVLAQGNSQAARFNRSLSKGVSGDDVRQLQEILAADSSVYPEGLITGYFGALTENAVKRFQKAYDIEQVGAFGPKTRAKMHSLLATGSTTISLPPGQAKKLLGLASTTVASTSALQGTQVTICHIPKGNSSNKQSITVGGPALKAHLAHGDSVGACGSTVFNPGTTTPSTTTPTTTTPATTTPPVTDATAPSISGLGTSSTTATTTTVVWTTNESATSEIWYSTVLPVQIASTTSFVSNGALVTSHSIDLFGLATSTPYFYIVVSADSSGNRATSTTAAFTTTP
jgi:peptidoglycan hydrolase-like protein with peptidoglycan-binding domain